MKLLFALRGFPHDPQGVLAAIQQLTLVGVELILDGGLSIPHVGVSGELGVATFADSEHWDIPNPFYDPKIALWHI